MIRWSYLMPRLILVAAFVALATFVVDPLFHRALIATGQSVTGAKVEVCELRTSLFCTAVRLQDVAIADPERTGENLIAADEIVLKLNSSELLKKNLIVDYGYIRGLRFNTERSTSGALAIVPEDEQPDSRLMDNVADFGQQVLDQLVVNLEAEANSLESVQLAGQLSQRWSAEYEQLEHRAEQLELQIRQLREDAKLAEDDPIAALSKADETLRQIDSLRKVPGELRAELNRLQHQVHQDRAALQQARRNDLQRLQQHIELVNFDSEKLAQYLVGDQWSDEVETLLGWLQTGQKMVKALGEPPELSRTGGRFVLFGQPDPQPSFLIRSLHVDGSGTVRKQPFQFVGRISGITSEPKIYGAPTVLRLQTRGAAEMQMLATVDRTAESPVTEIKLSIPQLAQTAKTWGDTDSLSVAVADGTANVWAEVKLTGNDQLAGRVIYRRDGLQLTPHLKPEYASKLRTNPWPAALRDVRSLHALVEISGRPTQPKFGVETNLGPQLASGLRDAVAAEVAAQHTALIARVEQETDQQMARIQQSFAQRQSELLDKLNFGESEIAALKSEIARQAAARGINVGNRLPIGDWLRKL
jgi:uncharacterized protein (TIGR03545 family)